jgi:hypothetical protein
MEEGMIRSHTGLAIMFGLVLCLVFYAINYRRGRPRGISAGRHEAFGYVGG